MNFKEEYKHDFADIKADDEFKKNLVKELNNTQMPRTSRKGTTNILVAAAALFLVVGGAYYANRNPQTEADNTAKEQLVAENVATMEGDNTVDIDNKVLAQTGSSEAVTEFEVVFEHWYDDAENDMERYTLFEELVGGETLKEIYNSDTQTFTEADAMETEERKQLIKKLKGASLTEDILDGKSGYYKAVFENNITIEFQVSEDGYVKLADWEAVYKLH